MPLYLNQLNLLLLRICVSLILAHCLVKVVSTLTTTSAMFSFGHLLRRLFGALKDFTAELSVFDGDYCAKHYPPINPNIPQNPSVLLESPNTIMALYGIILFLLVIIFVLLVVLIQCGNIIPFISF